MGRCTAYAYWPHMEARCDRIVISRTGHQYGGYVKDSSGKFALRCYAHLWGYDRAQEGDSE